MTKPPLVRRHLDSLARLASMVALVAVSGCNSSTRDASTAASNAADTSARAEELTSQMLEKYREAISYTDHATYVEQAVYRGEGVEHELPFYQMSLALQRPNKLRLTLEEALPSAEGVRDGCDIACDGDHLRARAFALPDQVLEAPAPDSIDDENLLPDPVLRGVFQGRGLGEVFPQLAMLLSRDDNELVFPDDGDPRMLPDAEIDGHSCYRVATTNPEGTRVLWIDRQNFTLWRMELPAEAHRRRYADGEMFLKLAVWIDFEEPTFGARIDEASFRFESPAAARTVENFEIPPADAKSADEHEHAHGDEHDHEHGHDDADEPADDSEEPRESPESARSEEAEVNEEEAREPRESGRNENEADEDKGDEDSEVTDASDLESSGAEEKPAGDEPPPEEGAASNQPPVEESHDGAETDEAEPAPDDE